MNSLDTSDRFTLIRHGDADAWIEAIAAEMAQALNNDIATFGRARMLLSGGTTPAPVYQALAELAEPAAQFPEVAVFRDSIQSSTRGITR